MLRASPLSPWLAALVVAGCDGAPPCLDRDLDRYGEGCELGPDCDEDNAARNADCDHQPLPDCDEDPRATGCPCLAGALSECLVAAGLDGVGLCRAGRTRCIAGHWGVCEGGVPPASERCDGLDQDCDGLADEGVTSPCGACTPGCLGGVWGPGGAPFPEGGGFEQNERGELTLGTLEVGHGAIWVPNAADGTISHIDAATATEVARHETGGREPSRVAVDWLDDAWVLNREFGGVPTVTKIAGSEARCVDRDGDGIETSRGPSDVPPLAEDECVLFSTPVGPSGSLGRAIAIDGDRGLDGASGGDAWLGLHDAQRVVEVDGQSGAVLRTLDTPGFSPYAASFDRFGTLWMASRDGLLARIDPDAEPLAAELVEIPYPCYLAYGMAIDREGRIAITGFACDHVLRYDSRVERWARLPTLPSPRGAALSERSLSQRSLFVAHTGAQLSEILLDRLVVVRTVALATSLSPFETVGAAVDGLGRVWTVSTRGGPMDEGVATRFDPVRGVVDAQVPVGRAPHTQGDLAGWRVGAEPVREASATLVFEGCVPAAETEWRRVHLDADARAVGRVALEARHARDRDGLAAEPFVALGALPAVPGPYALAFPVGGVIELRMTLSVDARLGAPRVRRVGVEWGCPGPD